MSIGGPSTARRPQRPPLILRLGSTGWETLVTGTFPHKTAGKDPFDTLFAENTLRLAPEARGKLWVAYPYTGRVVRFTSSGKPDLQMVFGKGTAKYKDDEQRRQKFLSRLKSQGYNNPNAQIGVFTAMAAIRGITEGRDGMLYLLLDRSLGGNGPVLARYNGVENVVEATSVRLADGEVSIAAGSDALAWTISGTNELWQLSWSALEAADWQPVENVRVLSGAPSVPLGSP